MSSALTAGAEEAASSAESESLSVLDDLGALGAAIRLRTAAGHPAGTVLDLGGGTGVIAVPLARAGHLVTVLDQSPDALATLARRTAAAGVADRVTGLVHDLDSFDGLSLTADIVLCHRVLEYVDDPERTLTGARSALSNGGVLSIVCATRAGSILARTVAGRRDEALAIAGDPRGRSGSTDQLQRRFDPAALIALCESVGLQVTGRRGIGLIDELGGQHGKVNDLAIRSLLENIDAFVEVAPYLHLIAEARGS